MFDLLSSASHVPLRLFVVPVSPVFTWREDLGVGAAVAVATSLLYLERLCARCEERQQQRCIDAAASQVET